MLKVFCQSLLPRYAPRVLLTKENRRAGWVSLHTRRGEFPFPPPLLLPRSRIQLTPAAILATVPRNGKRSEPLRSRPCLFVSVSASEIPALPASEARSGPTLPRSIAGEGGVGEPVRERKGRGAEGGEQREGSSRCQPAPGHAGPVPGSAPESGGDLPRHQRGALPQQGGTPVGTKFRFSTRPSVFSRKAPRGLPLPLRGGGGGGRKREPSPAGVTHPRGPPDNDRRPRPGPAPRHALGPGPGPRRDPRTRGTARSPAPPPPHLCRRSLPAAPPPPAPGRAS